MTWTVEFRFLWAHGVEQCIISPSWQQPITEEIQAQIENASFQTVSKLRMASVLRQLLRNFCHFGPINKILEFLTLLTGLQGQAGFTLTTVQVRVPEYWL